MKIEDIKVGETYNVRVTVALIGDSIIHCSIGSNTVNFWKPEVSEFSPISPENGIKNTETAPKYDPCRLLRKGDKVQVKKRDGRCNGKDGEYLREAFCTVAEDEIRNELVLVLHNATEYRLAPAYLELVTPVEELEPYYVEQQGEKTGDLCFTVRKRNGYAESTFYFGACRSRDEQQAKAAAEAERDRLNAEYRKEIGK